MTQMDQEAAPRPKERGSDPEVKDPIYWLAVTSTVTSKECSHMSHMASICGRGKRGLGRKLITHSKTNIGNWNCKTPESVVYFDEVCFCYIIAIS